MKIIFKIIGFWIIAEFLLLVLAFCMMWKGDSFNSAMHYIHVVTVDLLSGWKFHTVGFFSSGLVWLFLYFKKVYRSQGIKTMSKKLALYFLLPLGILFTSFRALDWYRYSEEFEWSRDASVFNSTSTVADSYSADGKVRAMHIFGDSKRSNEGLDHLVSDNVEWVAHVPYAYQRTNSTTDISHSQKDSLDQWSGRDSSFIRMAELAKSKGLRSIMKPHIWMSNAGSDEWRNAINFDNESEWKIWEHHYRSFIMHYAEMAQEYDMEILCIGVELRSTVVAREVFWRDLIRDVRMIYSGKVTYGANWWEEYEEVPFWDALDYIGIQAYFPVSSHHSPSISTIQKGWKPHISQIRQLSERLNKPVLFTEIGYKNTTDSATTPWEWPESIGGILVKASDEIQYNAYEAFFRSVWNEDWFAGALFWQWRISPDRHGERRQEITFSPQGKPAEQSMAKWYGKGG